MGCILTFNTSKGNILEKDSGLSSELFSNIPPEYFNEDNLKNMFGEEYKPDKDFDEEDVYALFLINNLSPEIIKQLVNLETSNDVVTVTSNVVPNRTVEDLKNEFPNVDFASSTPSILLVGDSTSTKISKPFISSILLEDGSRSYIVPRDAIFSFSAFSFRKMAVLRILDEDFDKDEFPELVTDKEGNNQLKDYIALNYNDEKSSAKLTLLTKILDYKRREKKATLIALNGNKDVKGAKNWVIELTAKIKEYENELAKHDVKTKVYSEKKLILDNAKAKLEENKKKVQELEEKLKTIDSDEYRDKEISQMISTSKLKMNTNINMKRPIAEILDDFIHDREKFKKVLSAEAINELDNVLDRLAEREKSYDLRDAFMNVISATISRNPQHKIGFKYLFELFQQHNWIKAGLKFKDFKLSDLKQIFQEQYLDKLDIFEFDDTWYDKGYLKLKYTPREALYKSVNQDVRTFSMFYANRNNYQRYKGYYVYNINGQWYYSDRILNEYSSPRPYRTKQDIFREIDKKLSNDTKLSKSRIYLQGEDLSTIQIPSGQTFRKGEILTAIDYQRGEIIPDITIGEFKSWFERVFSQRIKDLVSSKNLLDSLDKMAMFYSHFGNLTRNSLYDEDGILQFLNDIQKEKYYYVVEDSYEDGKSFKTLKSYITAQELSYNDLITPTTIGTNKYYTPTYIVLKSITDTLAKNGVPTKLVNLEEFNEVLKSKGLDPETHLNAKGMYVNGMVYINSEKATAETPIHEYTHILLGILKSTNQTFYQSLLSNVANTEEGKKMMDDIRQRYPNIKSETDLLEEAFADLYADYILGKRSKDLDYYFLFSDELVKSNDSIFDIGTMNMSGNPSLISLFNNFASQVRYGLRKIGFSLPIGSLYQIAKKFADENTENVSSKDVKSDKAIKEVCD